VVRAYEGSDTNPTMEKPDMKLLVIAPLSIGVIYGGARMQAIKTSEQLAKLGVEVNYYNPWETYEPAAFDIVHIFLAGNETLTLAKKLGDLNCKLAVSPIFFTRRSAAIIRNSLKLEAVAGKFIRGIFSDYSIKATVCRSADIILPNTASEAALIRDGFGIPGQNLSVIPNGVDKRFAEATPDLFISRHGIQNFTLFVGDCSARRKNILPLLEQHSPEDKPLVLIGTFDNSSYSESCLEIINSRENVVYLGPFVQDDPMLASAYAAADVFTLPSEFETPGIAALEAALAGCRIAITGIGGTREIFGDYAEYIDPQNKVTYMQAIRRAHEKPDNHTLKDRILEHYTWEVAGEQTLKAYKRILGQND